MKTRKQVIDQIRKNPGETLDDLTMLRQELETYRLMNRQLEQRLKISEFISGRNAERVEAYRKQLELADAILENRKV